LFPPQKGFRLLPMQEPRHYRMPKAQRRRAMRLGYLNGALWAAGNGLTSGALVYYFFLDMGISGLSLSLLLAVPALVGVLRLVAPLLLRWRGTARRVALESFWLSYALFAIVPTVVVAAAIGPRPGAVPAIGLLLGVVCLHQLLEGIGWIALYSWLADLVPQPIRGRYLAWRNIYQLLVVIPTLLLSGWLIDRWRAVAADAGQLPYAVVTAVGVAVLMFSQWPLHRMPATRRLHSKTKAAWLDAWRRLERPPTDRAESGPNRSMQCSAFNSTASASGKSLTIGIWMSGFTVFRPLSRTARSNAGRIRARGCAPTVIPVVT